MLTKVVHRTTH